MVAFIGAIISQGSSHDVFNSVLAYGAEIQEADFEVAGTGTTEGWAVGVMWVLQCGGALGAASRPLNRA
jgi:hypothetical protein